MIPRLTRFYGGSPMHWLDGVPVCVVRAHVQMLPVLQAQERVAAGAAAAVGAVQARAKRPAGWIFKLWSAWLRASKPQQRGRVRKPSVGELAAAGIGVRRRVTPEGQNGGHGV